MGEVQPKLKILIRIKFQRLELSRNISSVWKVLIYQYIFQQNHNDSSTDAYQINRFIAILIMYQW